MTDSKTREYRAEQIAEEAARRLDAMTDSKTATELLEELRSESLKFPPAIRRKMNIGLDRIEQAIAAILETNEHTCRNVAKEWEKTSFANAATSFCCSKCGAHYVDCECYYAGLADADEEQIRTNYCPNCGAKVIEEVGE